MKLTLLSFFVFVLAGPQLQAQRLDRYALAEKVGNFIHQLGPMKDYPLHDIIDTFKTRRLDEPGMVYAIYTWMAKNIELDCHAVRHPARANHTPSYALNKRSTTDQGFAHLFQAMCDLARIQCVTVSGLAKAHPQSIGKFEDLSSHTWNAVKIKNTWYNIDVTWGAGSTDPKQRHFTRSFTDAWFFTNADLFFLSHFPDDKKWQLAPEPVTKVMFNHAPVVGAGAVIFDIYPPEGLRGRIRGRERDCKPLIFEMHNPGAVGKVSVSISGVTQPAEFTKMGDQLLIEIPFQQDGTYPVTIYINDAPAFGFMAEVSKRRS